MKKRLRGMTLIELVATLGIIGVLAALAVPSFRGMQARSELKTSQQLVQSALYRLQQLAIAPLETHSLSTPNGAYDIVGYGLVFMPLPTNHKGTVTLDNCRITVDNDFIALYKFARPQSGNSDIRPLVMPADPSDTVATCNVKAKDYPNDFFVMPKSVAYGQSSPSLASPWLITRPLHAVGSSFGTLTASNYRNPFTITNNVTLSLIHKSVRRQGVPLCRTIVLNGTTIAIDATRTTTTCQPTL